MVVDGSKLVRKLIADVLQRDLPGVEVIGCDSIEDAQLALAQGPVDLVTTSLTLRDGDGLALARMVREAAGQAYVPVIVVSGDAQQHLEQRRFTEYVTDYFDKALQHVNAFKKFAHWRPSSAATCSRRPFPAPPSSISRTAAWLPRLPSACWNASS